MNDIQPTRSNPTSITKAGPITKIGYLFSCVFTGVLAATVVISTGPIGARLYGAFLFALVLVTTVAFAISLRDES